MTVENLRSPTGSYDGSLNYINISSNATILKKKKRILKKAYRNYDVTLRFYICAANLNQRLQTQAQSTWTFTLYGLLHFKNIICHASWTSKWLEGQDSQKSIWTTDLYLFFLWWRENICWRTNVAAFVMKLQQHF